jgi:ribonuclease P protein component
MRQSGIRVLHGPWVAYTSPGEPASLVVALGRAAGGAVTRSRIRRLARDVFREAASHRVSTHTLLMARGDLDSIPRRQARKGLALLFERATAAACRSMESRDVLHP